MHKKLLLFVFLCLFFVPLPVFANNPARMYYFYSDTCSHCKEAEVFLDEISNRYPDLQIVSYEVSHNEENYQLMLDVLNLLDISARGTPLIVLGSRGTVGFSDSVRLVIEENILYARYNEVRDVVGEIQGTSSYFEEKISDTNLFFDLPYWPHANLKQDNLVFMTLDLGLFSGISVLFVTLLLCILFLLILQISQWSLFPFWISFGILFLAFLTNGSLLTFSNTAWIVLVSLCILWVVFALFCHKFQKKFRIANYFSFDKVPLSKGTALFLICFSCFLVCLFFSIQNENVLMYQRLMVFRSITGFSSYLYAFLFLLCFLVPNLVVYFLFLFVLKKRKMVSKG